MTAARRITLHEAAQLAGVQVATVRKYRTHTDRYSREPFPDLDEDGKVGLTAFKAWLETRPGKGGAGTPKTREPQACEKCGTLVPRRWKDPADEVMVCKPCLRANDPKVDG